MAKRTTPPSQANDSSMDAGSAKSADRSSQPRARRVRASAPVSEEASASMEGMPGSEMSVALDGPATRLDLMSSEPREEDIRLRAYHLYLQRGSGHGNDFQDWLEAERELRRGGQR
jgi:Protein of unknown function (DUF2934)